MCAVCLEPLCEPVQWPGPCGHSFCLLCTLRVRTRASPACPLCRAPAVRIRRERDLRVDRALARMLRERRGVAGSASGAARYDAQKARMMEEVRRLLAECGGLRATAEYPLLCVGEWDFPQGERRGLQLVERRELAVGERALEAEDRSFGVVLANRATPGARGRVAKVVGHTSLPEGGMVVVVEGGEAFGIRRAMSEPRLVGRGSPALRGLVDLGEVPAAASATSAATVAVEEAESAGAARSSDASEGAELIVTAPTALLGSSSSSPALSSPQARPPSSSAVAAPPASASASPCVSLPLASASPMARVLSGKPATYATTSSTSVSSQAETRSGSAAGTSAVGGRVNAASAARRTCVCAVGGHQPQSLRYSPWPPRTNVAASAAGAAAGADAMGSGVATSMRRRRSTGSLQ